MALIHRVSSRYKQAFSKRPKTHISLWLISVLVLIPLAFVAYSESSYEYRDEDADRGAVLAASDSGADGYKKIVYLNSQAWQPSDSLWFYSVSQGSDLIPYDIFMALNGADGKSELRAQSNVQRWRYLPQRPTSSNPDGLPVGFAKDTYKGREYLGFTCAACHTTQINYREVGYRIDGGPTLADMGLFLADLVQALEAIAPPASAPGSCANEACTSFVKRVLARKGDYSDEKAVLDDLQTYRHRLAAYNHINASATVYGYARLDAFGRIYNRVLEHLVRKDDLAKILPEVFHGADLERVRVTLQPVIAGAQDDHVVERALTRLNDADREQLTKRIFNEPNAPVSYPYLWDTPQHDFVQWNALAANAGLGGVGRNVGEVVGVFGTLEWRRVKGPSLLSVLQMQLKDHVQYESSVNVHNLRRVEERLRLLQSPKWPDAFPRPEADAVARGEKLFDQHCIMCHGELDSTDPNRRVVVKLSSLDAVKTDRTMAMNSVSRMGYSALVRNEYARTISVGDILLDERAPVAAMVAKATAGVVETPYRYGNPLSTFNNWLYDLGYAYFTNSIKPSIKQGQYAPDTTADPYASLRAYKARPLNGIWATAPFLHNGSVPSLADLLLPWCEDGDTRPGECRPNTFMVGSREFDPVAIGLKSTGYAGFLFDTRKPGNSNQGHEYGTVNDQGLGARGLKAMDAAQRKDLLEYLKTL